MVFIRQGLIAVCDTGHGK